MNVAQLPTEILGEIFSHYVHDRPKIRQIDEVQTSFRRITAYTDSETHPTDLTQICRLWRNTAISIPRLWATIYVYKPQSEGNVKMFELWLERSIGSCQCCPLDLTIKQNMNFRISVQSPPPALRQVISLAISHHRRWRHISLELSENSAPFFKALYTTAPLPILRSLTISIRGWSSENLRQLVGVLCSSPELRSITLGRELSNPLRAQVLLDIIPWESPTTLNFIHLRRKMFFQILSSSMDNLQHISVSSLSDFRSSASESTSIPYVTMRCLQSIHIGTFADGDHPIFDQLTLPSLRELRLPNAFGPSDETGIQKRGWESLLNLLERSNCKLLSFEFGDDEGPVDEDFPGSPLTEDLLTKHLRSSPLFQHLANLRVTSAIGRYPDSTQLLEALSEVHASVDTQMPAMLPNLETLVLDCVHESHESSSLVDVDVCLGVRQMISARVGAYGGHDKSKLRRVCAQLMGEDFALDVQIKSCE